MTTADRVEALDIIDAINDLDRERVSGGFNLFFYSSAELFHKRCLELRVIRSQSTDVVVLRQIFSAAVPLFESLALASSRLLPGAASDILTSGTRMNAVSIYVSWQAADTFFKLLLAGISDAGSQPSVQKDKS